LTDAVRSRRPGLAVALAAAVAVPTAWRGGYTQAGRGIVVVLGAVALGAAIWQRPAVSARAARAAPVLLLGALGVLGAASAAWTVGPPDDALRWALVLLALAALVVAAAALPDPEAAAWILLGVATAAAAVGVAGAAGSIARISLDICGSRRPAGPFEYPPALALACVSALPCAVVGMARGNAIRRQAACAAAGWLLVFTVLVSGSRLEVALAAVVLAAAAALAPHREGPVASAAALVLLGGGLSTLLVGGALGHDGAAALASAGTVGVALVVAWMIARRRVPGLGRRAAWTSAVCVLGLIGVGASTAAERVGGCAYSGLAHGRTGIWAAAVRTARERPLAGHGLESFATASRRQQLRERPVPVQYAHNLPLEAWVELGLPGAALILALYGSVVVAALRAGRGTAVLLAPAALAFLAANLLDWPWHLAGSAAAFAIAVGGLIAAGPRNRPATLNACPGSSRSPASQA
jgi:O-Antigen ligase